MYPEMIGDFIEKYYIDPIRYGQPYNVVDTTTYALVLILAIYIIYRWLSRSRTVRIDRDFVLATLPYLVMGGLLRVVEDTGMVPVGWNYLLITPLIYFVMFFYAAGVLCTAAALQERGYIRDYHRPYAGAGVAGAVAIALVLAAFGIGNGIIALDVLVLILALAVATTGAVYLVMRYLLSWDYVGDPSTWYSYSASSSMRAPRATESTCIPSSTWKFMWSDPILLRGQGRHSPCMPSNSSSSSPGSTSSNGSGTRDRRHSGTSSSLR